MPETDSLIHPMSRHINELVAQLDGYTRQTMIQWAAIREHFKRERDRRGLTQKEIAIAGDVDQGAISKLEADERYMPSLMTFLGAIQGLGYRQPSEFFHEIEQLTMTAGSYKKNVFISHHAPPEGDFVSTPAATAGAGAGPDPVERFRDALGNFLRNLQIMHSELEQAERLHTAATPPKRARRAPRAARRR
jgi:transcriptional regulator with XRE-family HTH domain